jgi:hypothetical protein
MNEKQREELRTLAEGLRLVPEEKFYMSFWGRGTLRPDAEDFSCDYAGCAIGWAPRLIPGCGLELAESGGGMRPRYNGKDDFWAVADYFGLEVDDTFFLFMPDGYPDPDLVTPEEVSDRILAFLEDPELREKHRNRYTVRVTEFRRFSNTLEVEARTREEAEEKARDLFECDWYDSDCEEFFTEVVGRECIG